MRLRSPWVTKMAAVALGPLAPGHALTVAPPPTPGTAWVLGYFEGSPLIPISLASGKLGTPVQIGDEFDDDAIAITPNAQTAFVAQNASNLIVPVDLATGTVSSRSTWRRSRPASPSHLTAEPPMS
jgi:hypothetical protein